MESPGGVNRPVFLFAYSSSSFASHLVAVFRPPLSSSIKVFQSEADGVDLAMTARALGFFPVCQESFSLGEDLTFQT